LCFWTCPRNTNESTDVTGCIPVTRLWQV
jgi:hypothetical protein